MENQDYKRIYRSAAKVIPRWMPHEYMLLNNAGKSALPTEGVPTGSTAYNKDMTEMYMFDGTTWNELGGEDE